MGPPHLQMGPEAHVSVRSDHCGGRGAILLHGAARGFSRLTQLPATPPRLPGKVAYCQVRHNITTSSCLTRIKYGVTLLPALAGIRPEAAQEAAGQGGRGQTGGLRGEYAALWEEAQRTGARIFFADEAHFRADAELLAQSLTAAATVGHRLWYSEKASYYSEGCLETGEVEWMELEGNSNVGISAAFLKQLRGKQPGGATGHLGQCSGPSRRGGAGVPRDAWTGAPAVEPPFSRGQALPGSGPDFNADEAIWRWARQEATVNLCLGSRVAVQDRAGKFLAGLASRKDEVKRRCRTVLQSRAEAVLRASRPRFPVPGKCISHLGFGLALQT